MASWTDFIIFSWLNLSQVNVLKATELYILKCLTWWILFVKSVKLPLTHWSHTSFRTLFPPPPDPSPLPPRPVLPSLYLMNLCGEGTKPFFHLPVPLLDFFLYELEREGGPGKWSHFVFLASCMVGGVAASLWFLELRWPPALQEEWICYFQLHVGPSCNRATLRPGPCWHLYPQPPSLGSHWAVLWLLLLSVPWACSWEQRELPEMHSGGCRKLGGGACFPLCQHRLHSFLIPVGTSQAAKARKEVGTVSLLTVTLSFRGCVVSCARNSLALLQSIWMVVSGWACSLNPQQAGGRWWRCQSPLPEDTPVSERGCCGDPLLLGLRVGCSPFIPQGREGQASPLQQGQVCSPFFPSPVFWWKSVSEWWLV